MSDARQFGEAMDSFVRRLDPKGKRFSARVVEAWSDIAGAEIRAHTRGVAFRSGELLVSVDSAAWANELVMFSERLRTDMNSVLGEETVKSIRFNVSRKVQQERAWERLAEAEQAFYETDKLEGVPLTDLERRQVEYCAAPITDEALREAAMRAMTKDLEWKKAVRLRNVAQRASEGPERADSPAE